MIGHWWIAPEEGCPLSRDVGNKKEARFLTRLIILQESVDTLQNPT